MMDYEFTVTCEVCGKISWIYGNRDDEDSYQDEGYTCSECKEGNNEQS